MTEQDLHDPDVDAVLNQPCRVRMPQGMRCHAVANARRVSRFGEGVRQHVSVERSVETVQNLGVLRSAWSRNRGTG